MRRAAMAWPGASAQSRMSAIGVPGWAAWAAAIRARHQPHPMKRAAPGAESRVTGWPGRKAAHAPAKSCTTMTGWKNMLDVQAPAGLKLKYC